MEQTPQWQCLVCGYVHTGSAPPEECPICFAPMTAFEQMPDSSNQPAPEVVKVQDYFSKLEFSHGHNMLTLNALMPVATSINDTIAPQPGRMPECVGQFGSRFVAISLAPSSTICTACSSISKLRTRPSPTTT